MSKPGSKVAGGGQIAFLLTQVGAQAAMRFAERLAPLGLTPPQAGLLRAVGTEPGRSQQALATQLGVLPSRLVALIDELEHDGLLERRPNPDDRRHHAVHLTDAGKERLREVGRIASLHGDDYLNALSPAECATLARLLGKLATEHGLTPGVHPGYRNLDRQNDLTVSNGP
jgi:DNA-binding MarR family transcriptional regulator